MQKVALCRESSDGAQRACARIVAESSESERGVSARILRTTSCGPIGVSPTDTDIMLSHNIITNYYVFKTVYYHAKSIAISTHSGYVACCKCHIYPLRLYQNAPMLKVAMSINPGYSVPARIFPC